MDFRCAQRKTKIVATIGPACSDEQSIEQLLLSGVNVARLNFSHGSHEDHAVMIRLLRKIALRLNQPLAILQDLQGPKIRIGNLPKDAIEIKVGQILTLTTQSVPKNDQWISVDFKELPHSVSPGGRILIDDGNLELVVLSVGSEWVETKVVVGGIIKPHKGINLPGGALGISAITDKDRIDLLFGIQQGVDAVALSFVRTADDIRILRNEITNAMRAAGMLTETNKYLNIPIIAKLERPEALDNLEAIVSEADGVMVARGDLGVEMSPEAVPIAQKRIIECANRNSKIVITATQMLDSMILNPRPTRAEASDVANAIFDGTDAVMLSGETASGKYPLKAVQTMNAIACQAEAGLERWGHWKGPEPVIGGDHGSDTASVNSASDDTFYMTMAARALARDRDVAAIAIFTMSGRTALLMSKTRPDVPVLAFTPDENIYRRMSLYWGVQSHLVPHALSLEQMLEDVEDTIHAENLVKPGQQIVLICGYPVGEIFPTNLALLHRI